MQSKRHGKHTSESHVEVQGITREGVWILVGSREYFLPHAAFPWFATAAAEAVFDVALIGERHLHWPRLDVDLELDSLVDPERYPLVSR